MGAGHEIFRVIGVTIRLKKEPLVPFLSHGLENIGVRFLVFFSRVSCCVVITRCMCQLLHVRKFVVRYDRCLVFLVYFVLIMDYFMFSVYYLIFS